MLQQSTNPPHMSAMPAVPSDGYGVIDARIQPLEKEPEQALICEIEYFVREGDIQSLCALYDGYIAASEAISNIRNQPRAEDAVDFLEEERNRLMSKAYLVADHLQHMKPSRLDHVAFCRVLFDCAIQMGNEVGEAIALLSDVPKPDWREPAP